MMRLQKKRKIIPPKPYFWSKTDTYRTLGILLLLIILWISIDGGFDFFRNKRIDEYTGRTEGIVLTIKDNKFNSQSFCGGMIIIVSYTIHYKYTIGNKEYTGNNTLPYKEKYIKFYNEIFTGKELKIGCKINQPEKSIILIN